MRFAAARGSVRIAYDVLGTGTPLVMLHHFGESSGFWHEFGYVEGCLARGRQVVLIDLRGHGESSKPVDAAAYGCPQSCRDVIAVLNDAGIDRADLLGYGMGGRIALSLAIHASERVCAVAAGAAHPFAERTQLHREALANGLEAWVDLVERSAGGLTAQTRRRLMANDPAAIAAVVECDRPDMADALATSRVPILLFLGKQDPRYPLAVSFAEQAGARFIGLAGRGSATSVGTCREILPRILDFLEEPQDYGAAEPVPPALWSGSWA
jgi:pimeloyl-ACP methyl ester carboxylesterase